MRVRAAWLILSRGGPNLKRVLGLVLALFLCTAASAAAQIATGNIYGTVADQQGAVLPGVTVSLVSTSWRLIAAGDLVVELSTFSTLSLA